MNNRSQVFTTILILVISLIAVVLISFGSLGKVKLNYTTTVEVKNGAISGDNGQSIYMKAPGEECTFDVVAEGTKEILSDVMVYKNSSTRDSYLLINATDQSKESDKVQIVGETILLQVNRRIADGATVKDGSYDISYKITVKNSGGSGKTMLILAIAVVMIFIAIIVLVQEGNKDRTCTKRQLRLRGRAFANAFLALVVLVLTFSLMSGFVDQFPFTTFQSGMISFLIATTIFMISADRNRAFTAIREKRGLLVVLFAIIAGLNLFAVLLDLVVKKSASTASIANGQIGNWVINAFAAVCFFVMMMELLMQNAKEASLEASRERRRVR